MKISMTRDVKKILSEFYKNGKKAYLVGGAVRDSLLGRDVVDFDICSDALPSETASVFGEENVLFTGEKYGTVTLFYNDKGYEITTFRSDGVYGDGRHPESVTFGKSLAEDLSRRDFTVNAMAAGPGGEIIDYHGGLEDLDKRVIRAVGNPEKRFSEDALRIIRAIRFSQALGFDIEAGTFSAMKAEKERLRLVSKERIGAEILKMVRFPFMPHEHVEIISEAFDGYVFGDTVKSLGGVSFSRKDFYFAALFADTPKEAACGFLSSMALGKDVAEMSAFIADNAIKSFDEDGAAELLVGNGRDKVKSLAAFKEEAFSDYNLSHTIDRFEREKRCFSRAELALTGGEIKNLGFTGKEIGEVSDRLVRLCAGGKLKNEKSSLAAEAEKYRKKI